jgi:hypothetical protein
MLEVPPLIVIPPNTSPLMASFLTLRNQLRRAQTQLWNQYVNADPAVREAVMEQWWRQNATQLAQMQQQGQDLANSLTQN